MPKIRLGAAQLAEEFMDVESTVKKDVEYIKRAGEMDIDLLVFPEYHIPASPHWYKFTEHLNREEYYQKLFENALEIPGKATEKLCNTAREAGTAVVVGVNEKEPDTLGTMYNTQIFIDADGTFLGSRRKMKPTVEEQCFHTGGSAEDLRVFDSSLGKISGMMCGEHANPLIGFTLAAKGEKVHAASWPAFPEQFPFEGRERLVLVRTRYHAATACVPAACATGVVTDGLIESLGTSDLAGGDTGTSAIIGPRGNVLTDVKRDGEGIVHAEVDTGEGTKEKSEHDVIGHYNRFDIFQLTINETPQKPLKTIRKDEDEC